MRILVDQDDVIANFGKGLDSVLDSYGQEAVGMHRSQLYKSWDMFGVHTEHQQVILRRALASEGLFLNLEPIDGALQALYEMEYAGHDVRIVTSPMTTNHSCASDKLAWVSRYLGDDWRKRTILTDDKTVIRGDVLFDDKGEITGSMRPEWQQILVDQPHNQTLKKDLPRIASLAHWRTALEVVFG